MGCIAIINELRIFYLVLVDLVRGFFICLPYMRYAFRPFVRRQLPSVNITRAIFNLSCARSEFLLEFIFFAK